jgi:hypothetical protein
MTPPPKLRRAKTGNSHELAEAEMPALELVEFRAIDRCVNNASPATDNPRGSLIPSVGPIT